MKSKVNAKQVKQSFVTDITDEFEGLSTFPAVPCGYQWVQEGGLAKCEAKK